MHGRRRWWLVPLGALAIAGLVLLAVGGPSGVAPVGSSDAIADARSHADPSRTASASEHARDGERPRATTDSTTTTATTTTPLRTSLAPPDHDEAARREARRQAILAAQRARDAQARAALPSPPSEPPPAAPGLTKRIEGHDELLAELDRDFMPLADECMELARERDPELAGLLSLEFELVVDEQLGAIVETVDFPVEGNVADTQLHECLRESMLSVLLPPGSASGREALMLSLRVDE